MSETPDTAADQDVGVGGSAPDELDPGRQESAGRVPTWVWVTLSALGIAIVAVTLALFSEARSTSEDANAASASATQLMDDLVGNVETANVELKEFNDQFAGASASAQENASSAQEKKAERSSSKGQSP